MNDVATPDDYGVLSEPATLTIQRLRRQAEEERGDRFDIRAFHDQVLNSGALPLSVLEDKIDRWIADGMQRPKRLKMAKPAALAMAEASLIPLD